MQWLRRIPAAVLIVIGLLLVARAILPIAIQRYVNRVLARDETYIGHVGDVDVALIRGAYQVEDVRIDKRNGKVPVPFFTSPVVDFSIQWRALFDGRVRRGPEQLEQPGRRRRRLAQDGRGSLSVQDQSRRRARRRDPLPEFQQRAGG